MTLTAKTGHEILSLMRYGDVYRFHTRPVLKRDTVMEHSGRAVLLMMALWSECTIKALKAMLTHDLAEWSVGDVPAPVKTAHPEIGAKLDAIEAETMRVTSVQAFLIDAPLTSEELWWVEFCDRLEGACYALRERMMGNLLVANPFTYWIPKLHAHVDRHVWMTQPERDALHRMVHELDGAWSDPETIARLYL